MGVALRQGQRGQPGLTKQGQSAVPWEDDQHCLVCGSQNPIGLKLDFRLEGDQLKADWKSDKRFQGYADVVHGGILSAVLDETMVNLPWYKTGKPVISAELNVRCRNPAKVGETISFSSWMDEPRRSMVLTHGKAVGEDGRLLAESTAKCVFIKDNRLQARGGKEE